MLFFPVEPQESYVDLHIYILVLSYSVVVSLLHCVLYYSSTYLHLIGGISMIGISKDLNDISVELLCIWQYHTLNNPTKPCKPVN